jgi:outer membrane lipoprotein SlyB
MENTQELIGKRITLIRMDDAQAPESGTKGIITKVDGMGQIHVRWDNGSTLAVVPEEDEFLISKS